LTGEVSRDFITAVGKLDDGLIIMIDVDRVFSSGEMSQIVGSLKAAQKEIL
jgi:chemotaxis signal transduction protein